MKHIDSFWVSSFGTGKVDIFHSLKMGTVTLDDLTNYSEINYNQERFTPNTIYVMLLRDAFDKWKSGYATELLNRLTGHSVSAETFMHNFQNEVYETFTILPYGTNTPRLTASEFDAQTLTLLGLELISNAHEIELTSPDFGFSKMSWMVNEHAKFSDFGMGDSTLEEVPYFGNVYFLELKDLSNPKFLIWLQEKDEKWKVVKEIPHSNKTEFFWENIQLFWKEYTEGKIAKGVSIHSPFYPTENPEMKGILKDIELEQEVVDNIRKYNKRYIKL
jgi:hypothetical protein